MTKRLLPWRKADESIFSRWLNLGSRFGSQIDLCVDKIKGKVQAIPIPTKRLLNSLVTIAFMGVFVVGVDVFIESSNDQHELSVYENNMSAFLEAVAVQKTNLSPESILSQIEQLGSTGIATESRDLLDEIKIPEAAEQFRFDPSTSIFSFSIEGDSQSVLQLLTDVWAHRGWKAVPLGGLNGTTFMKEEGEYQWMIVTCTEIGTQVCVVGNPVHI